MESDREIREPLASLLVSASLSAPVAALMIKRMEGKKLRVLVGVATTLLGLGTVLKAVFW